MPTISVIVPVYNAQKHIHRCVDSILAQTFTDFELILVDDGSPDNCGAICDEYAAKDSRIRVIHQENQGQAAARNHAVAVACGEWVCFVDSDDMIHPQMLEHLYRAAQEPNVGISVCGATEAEAVPANFTAELPCSYHTMQMDETGLQNLYETGVHRYWVIWGKLIKKEIAEKIPFEVGRIYEDNAVACRWLHTAKVITNTECRYYFYQINPKGTTQSKLTPRKLDYLWALEQQLNFYQEVHYGKMREIILKIFLTTAVSYYFQFKDVLKQADTAEAIKKHIARVYCKHFMYDKLEQRQRMVVYSIAYPWIHHLYELNEAVLRILTEKGFAGLLKRVFQGRKGDKK